MQKLNTSADRVQKIEVQKAVICLVIMCIPGVMVMKMSKMAILNFLLIIAKMCHSLGKALKRI